MADWTDHVLRLGVAAAVGYAAVAVAMATLAPTLTLAGLADIGGLVVVWVLCSVGVFVGLTVAARALSRREGPIARVVATSYSVSEAGLVFTVTCALVYWGPELLGRAGRPSLATVVAAGVGAAVSLKGLLYYRDRRQTSRH